MVGQHVAARRAGIHAAADGGRKIDIRGDGPVVSPRDDPAVAPQRQALSGNSHHVAQRGGGLVRAAPPDDGPVAAQRQALIPASGNGHHVDQACGDVRLAGAIGSPRDDRAVAPQRQTVIQACGNGHHVAQAGGDVRLAGAIGSPRDDRAIAA